jgi:hypothetical protein
MTVPINLHEVTITVPTHVEEGDGVVHIGMQTIQVRFKDEQAMHEWLLSLNPNNWHGLDTPPGVVGSSYLVEDNDDLDHSHIHAPNPEDLDRIDSKRIADEHTKLSQELDNEDREFARRAKT